MFFLLAWNAGWLRSDIRSPTVLQSLRECLGKKIGASFVVVVHDICGFAAHLCAPSHLDSAPSSFGNLILYSFVCFFLYSPLVCKYGGGVARENLKAELKIIKLKINN